MPNQVAVMWSEQSCVCGVCGVWGNMAREGMGFPYPAETPRTIPQRGHCSPCPPLLPLKGGDRFTLCCQHRQVGSGVEVGIGIQRVTPCHKSRGTVTF